MLFLVLSGGAYWLYTALPTSFVPNEDQGVLLTQIQLPNGANAARTQAVVKQVEAYFLNQEKDAVQSVFTTVGFGYGGSGENNAMAFVRLKDFSVRQDRRLSAAAVAGRASAFFQSIRDAQVFALAPPAIQGLGQANGFDMYLEDTANQGRDALDKASDALASTANAGTVVSSVRGSASTVQSQLQVVIDQEKAGALGVNLSDANDLLGTAFGGTYVNDFVSQGEIKPVYVEGDAPYRMQPGDIDDWYARNNNNEMVPFSAFASTQWTQGPPTLARFNGSPAIEIQGQPATNVSSGDAMTEMQRLVTQLPGGYGVAWSGLSYQEQLSGSQATTLYAISLLVVFLCLAALYESWSIPFSVILAVPVGVFGALLSAKLFGQSDDVYFKVGLLTTIGLAAKNAILMIEFATRKRPQAEGRTALEAIVEAARKLPRDSPDRYDLARLHPRRAAAGCCKRRGLRRAELDRLRGARRHDRGDAARRILRADLLPLHPRRLAPAKESRRRATGVASGSNLPSHRALAEPIRRSSLDRRPARLCQDKQPMASADDPPVRDW